MTVPAAMGDYQTAQRMAQKLSAIPIPADLSGKSVLDVGCDHGWWCKLAADRGAARVLGLDRGRGVRVGGGLEHLDLAARNNSQGWDRCEFQSIDLAKERPDLGAFDVVFCFSIYHHWYGELGSHDKIWVWLAERTRELLLWEGPVDTRDPIARDRAKGRPYMKREILNAAERYFDIEYIGPALHRPHREVWRCIPKGVTHDRGDSLLGDGRRESSVPASRQPPDPPAPAIVRVGALPGDAQRARDRSRRFRQATARAGPAHRTRNADRPLALVASSDSGRPAMVGAPMPGRVRSPRPQVAGSIPGGGGTAEPAITRGDGWHDGPTRTDRAMVIGGAECVWRDVRTLEAMLGHEWDGLVIAVNDVGCHWPRRLHHWCSLHAANLPKWKKDRAAAGYDMTLTTWSGTSGKQADKHVGAWGGGSSGLLAVSVATALGCAHVVLCGVPMEKAPHFHESKVHQKGKIWAAADSHWRAWIKPSVLARMKHVRSMSGRTGQTLGAPTLEWLGVEQLAAMGAE